MTTRAEPAPRRVGAAVLLVLVALALAVVLATTRPDLARPVTVDLPDAAPRLVLGDVEVGAAAVLLCLVAAGARLRKSTALGRAVEASFLTSVTVFLVAQLNGVADVGALVLVYAATSALWLFAILQDRVEVRRGHPMLPLSFGTAIGIVPWGVIALHQVGGLLAGGGPTALARVLTLVMLALSAAQVVAQWRGSRPGSQSDSPRWHAALTTASPAALALLLLLGAAAGAW